MILILIIPNTFFRHVLNFSKMPHYKTPVFIATILYLLCHSKILANPNEGHQHGHTIHLDPDDPDFSGVVDFSNAIPGPDGTWCISKTKYVEHMVKDSIKECWHQNVTQCHDSYVTEFLPSQEQKCEETFWKSCKIDFKEKPYNYTMKQCHTPLEKDCRPMPKGNKMLMVKYIMSIQASSYWDVLLIIYF